MTLNKSLNILGKTVTYLFFLTPAGGFLLASLWFDYCLKSIKTEEPIEDATVLFGEIFLTISYMAVWFFLLFKFN